MVMSAIEIFDIILMVALIGFLFMDAVKPVSKRKNNVDVLDKYLRPKAKNSSWKQRFLFSAAVIAPSIVLHELAHKFVAIAFGYQATFHAFYANSTTLFLGVLAILAKLTGFGFVFLVPGFVSMSASIPPATSAFIAFSGPAMHGLFWLGGKGYLLYAKKHKIKLSPRTLQILALLISINGFLFILNLLPIPGIDGFHIYRGIFQALAG